MLRQRDCPRITIGYLELRAWYEDWSETARAVIRRRDYLVMLGLVSRRVRPSDSAEAEDDAEAPADETNASVPTSPASPPPSPDNGAAAEAPSTAS